MTTHILEELKHIDNEHGGTVYYMIEPKYPVNAETQVIIYHTSPMPHVRIVSAEHGDTVTHIDVYRTFSFDDDVSSRFWFIGYNEALNALVVFA